MGEVRISQSKLDEFASMINSLASRSNSTRNTVNDITAKYEQLSKAVAECKSQFEAFVIEDKKAKELSNAKARIVHVRQQLQSKFGGNDLVRKYLSGILEASDISIVKNSIIKKCTEEVMISCPEYWLAPCLVALAAWIDDNKALAERAIAEAIKRDDEKTCLLFSLICRRYGRMDAVSTWLGRYLSMQDPRSVERKMTTVLDAYSNDLFGPAAKETCRKKINAWVDELDQEDEFNKEQIDRWAKLISSLITSNNYGSQFPESQKYATNWSALNNAISETSLHPNLVEYFSKIKAQEVDETQTIEEKLDALLENFITSYDDAELPLRREERMLQLIIEERGDVEKADERFQAEQKAMEDDFNFADLLTSVAMNADVIKASVATQHLGISLSRGWIEAAYRQITEKMKSARPDKTYYKIGKYEGATTDGSESADLIKTTQDAIVKERDTKLSHVVKKKSDKTLPIVFGIISGVFLLIFCLLKFGSSIPFVQSINESAPWVKDYSWPIGVIGVFITLWLIYRKTQHDKEYVQTRESIAKDGEQQLKVTDEAITGICSERKKWLELIGEKDSAFDDSLSYVQQL